MNMVTETKHLDYGDKLVDFYNSIDWGWLFDFVREKIRRWHGAASRSQDEQERSHRSFLA